MIKDRAKHLRRNQTEAEKHLWRALRNRQVASCKFRRQYAVGPYIVDFACVEWGLVIELDGGQHAEREEHDTRRTEFLREKGFRVLRFWNNEVLGETAAVMERIHGALVGTASL